MDRASEAVWLIFVGLEVQVRIEMRDNSAPCG